MSDKFNAIWEADDGYVGGSRPHTTHLYAADIEEDMSNEELEDYIVEAVKEDFQEKVSFEIDNINDALEWAKAVRDRKAKDAAE